MSPSPIIASQASRRRGSGVGGGGSIGAAPILALSNLSTANYYGTLSTGGEAGVSTGFGSMVLYVPTRPAASVYRGLAGKSDGSSTGWFNQLNAVQQAGFSARGSAWSEPLTRTLGASETGRIHCEIGWHTGSAVKVATDTLQQVWSLAVTGYTPNTGNPHCLGRFSGGNGADDCLIVAHLTFRGTPTDAQLQALMDLARSKGDVPTAAEWPYGITHRWSLKEALAGTTVTDGQAAPATLVDTVTAASADVMTKQGSPTVKVIDTSIDGRKSFGVLGAGAFNWLQTAAGAGLVGQAAGFSVAVRTTIDSLAATSQGYLIAQHTGSNAGWYLGVANAGAGTLRFAVADGAAAIRVAQITLTAADVGVPILIEGEHDGTTLRLRINGVERATQAITGYTHLGTTVVGIGGHPVNNWPMQGATVWQASIGNGALTAGERTAIAASFTSTGLLVPVAGKHSHHWHPTIDIAVTGPDNGMPATIADRIGTDALTRVGTMTVNGTGLRTFQSTFPISMGVANGLTGTAAGWWIEMLVRPVASAAANQSLFSNTGASPNGLNVYLPAGSANVSAQWGDGAATPSVSGVATAGALTHVCAVYDGAKGSLYINGTLAASTANFTYAPGSLETKLGTLYLANTAYNIDQTTHYGAAGGHAIPTAGEIATASAAALAGGKVVGIPSKTHRLWSIPDDIAENGGKVPAIIKDRAPPNYGCHLVMVGSGVQVSRRTERVWSYETTPTMYGGRNWSVSNHLSVTTTLASLALPFWIACPFIVHAKAGATYQNFVAKTNSGNTQGFTLYTGGTNAWLQCILGSGSAAISSATYTFADGDIGKVILVGYQWTGTQLQTFVKRAALGSGVTAASFAPFAGSLAIGRDPSSTSNPATDNLSVLGLMGGLGSLALSEWQTAVDAFASEERLIAVPGKTSRLWNIGRNGGSLAVADEMGSGETLTLNGSALLSSTYHHAIAA